MSKENTATHAAINAAVEEALRMAADVCDEHIQTRGNRLRELTAGEIKERIEALIPPTSEQDSVAQGASESDQRKLGFAEGWKEAAIAWEVCASLHREFAKGKDPLYTTRQSDFVKHADAARAALASTPPTDSAPLTIDDVRACPACRSVGFEASILGPEHCTFCDGTEGGNPPDTVTREESIYRVDKEDVETMGINGKEPFDQSEWKENKLPVSERNRAKE